MSQPTINTPKKILIFCLPALGDVLLITPVIRSLKNAYPESKIDLMIKRGTEGILEGNPDINQIFTCHQYKPIKDYFMMFKATAFAYDLALSTSASDRAFWCTMLAAKKRLIISKPFRILDTWKYLGTHQKVPDDHQIHIVERNLRLIDRLNIPRCYDLIPPSTANATPKIDSKYAIVHAYPRVPFKLWNIEYWQEIIKYLQSLNLQVVLTGGPDKEELAYLKQLANEQTKIMAGKVSLAESSELIKNAELLVGIDTGTTHLAAATGVPLIALFGPTSPIRWSPWPKDYQEKVAPFSEEVGIQMKKNITVIKAPCNCHLKGEPFHEKEKQQSACMREIKTEQVKQAIDLVLEKRLKA